MALFELNQTIRQHCVLCGTQLHTLAHVCDVSVFKRVTGFVGSNIVIPLKYIPYKDKLHRYTVQYQAFLWEHECVDDCFEYQGSLPSTIQTEWRAYISNQLELPHPTNTDDRYHGHYSGYDSGGDDDDSDCCSWCDSDCGDSDDVLPNYKLNLGEYCRNYLKNNHSYYQFHRIVFYANLLKSLDYIEWTGPSCLMDKNYKLFQLYFKHQPKYI